MWTQVSFAVCTQNKVCPVIGKGNKKAGALVVCIDGWTCHEPMQGLLRRVVFPTTRTRKWLLKSWRFRAWTTKRNVKFEKWKRTELAARNCSTTHHARAPPICRVPSWLVFDSAILFLNSFSENVCSISPHSLETDLYVRYKCCSGGGGGAQCRTPLRLFLVIFVPSSLNVLAWKLLEKYEKYEK